MIIDQFGTIVSYPDPEQINTKLDPSIFTNISSNLSGSFYSAKSKQMIVYQTITGTDWKVIVIVPYGDLEASYDINDIKLWHYFSVGRMYHDVAPPTMLQRSAFQLK
ncbi:hypothetical protein [Paenibacillus ferrarius]|nr:hypothetical protein [Paenibacillus ferrarius]